LPRVRQVRLRHGNVAPDQRPSEANRCAVPPDRHKLL